MDISSYASLQDLLKQEGCRLVFVNNIVNNLGEIVDSRIVS